MASTSTLLFLLLYARFSCLSSGFVLFFWLGLAWLDTGSVQLGRVSPSGFRREREFFSARVLLGPREAPSVFVVALKEYYLCACALQFFGV